MLNKKIAKIAAAGGVIAAGISAGLSPVFGVGIWFI